MKFAGVAIGSPESSEKWLESTLLGKRVWFTLLDHAPDKKSLASVVYAKHKVSAFDFTWGYFLREHFHQVKLAETNLFFQDILHVLIQLHTH